MFTRIFACVADERIQRHRFLSCTEKMKQEREDRTQDRDLNQNFKFCDVKRGSEAEAEKGKVLSGITSKHVICAKRLPRASTLPALSERVG